MKGRGIVLVAGARPNYMKVAPVLASLRAHAGAPCLLVHTGQHYDEGMSRLFFRDLEMPPPDVELEVGSASHAVQTARILERFEGVLAEERPALVLVVGDVNSTLACALAAAKMDIAVAHVEAGLRSFDRTMPEEINRVLTDDLSELHFVTEPSGVENLTREGKDARTIHLVGNVMIDTLLRHRERSRSSDVLERVGVKAGEYAVLTLHRPSNVDDPATLSRILEPILETAATMPVVFPVHPRTRQAMAASGLDLGAAPGMRVLDPLGYLDFLKLLSVSSLVLTDSGGIQEETTILGVPCVTLRENTERPITVTHGTNRIGGTTPASIRAAIRESRRSSPARPAPPLWDGRASERIAGVVRTWLHA